MMLYTIGFTQKSAERFFALLAEHDVEQIVDIRLKPGGQLSGFAKQDDLAWFLDRLNGASYVHLPELAPSAEIRDDYRQDHDWERYVPRFEALMEERGIPESLDRTLFTARVTCLLCSEPTPERCHRRLVAERLARAWPDVEVVHLGSWVLGGRVITRCARGVRVSGETLPQTPRHPSPLTPPRENPRRRR
jgi:uncharacterized protein (DUF488 family)